MLVNDYFPLEILDQKKFIQFLICYICLLVSRSMHVGEMVLKEQSKYWIQIVHDVFNIATLKSRLTKFTLRRQELLIVKSCKRDV